MNVRNFKDNLKKDNVEVDKSNILPKLGANKQRLEVEKIDKIISDVTDGIFGSLKNDEDVYNALQNISGQDARLVFNACAKNLGIECDVDELNKLNKSRMVALFFEVFGVYPETNPGSPPPTSDTELFNIVFPNFNGAVELEFSKIADSLPPQIRNVRSSDELEVFFNQSAEGQDVRNFVDAAIKASGISCDFNELRALRREEYLPLFFHAINLKFAEYTPSENKNKPAPTNILSWDNFSHFDALFAAAKKISAFDLDFDITGELKILKENPVTVKDGFYFTIPEGYKILRGLVGIVSLEGKTVALGHIEDGIVDGKVYPHAVFDWNKIHAEEFANRKRFIAVLIPKNAESFLSQTMSKNLASSYTGDLWTLEFKLNYKAVPDVTDQVLCIDFGTSNTTCGTYDLDKGSSVQLVTFRDVTSDAIIDREILPTIVYVESCNNGKVTSYKYGYEAKKEIIDAGYNTMASVFYEIKRWINSLDKLEEVNDKNGESATVTRGEILRGYLMHVIKAAEQQFKVKFKNLHMTAPVKLRKKFINEMKKILPKDYTLDENGLDEGVAVVYHYIVEHIKNVDDTEGKILILDCGGGTTDLSSCNFKIEHGGDWPVLKIETDFENGDSNFGGNNITYRILQMIKMKIASNVLRNENLRMHDLIPDDDEDILSQIDFSYKNKDAIYEKFENEYALVEKFIPTKFAAHGSAGKKRNIKRNFYYLWQIAEAVKIEFFKSNLVNVDFEKDRKIYAQNIDEYYLNIAKDGDKLQKVERPMDGVEITIREITRILLPDLYALLKTLLRNYSDDELTKYRCYLSGQSCKINQFRDLFKEFIPGNLMRIPMERGEIRKSKSTDSVDLKKYCISGSIEYVRGIEGGGHKPLIKYNLNRRIYEINIVVSNNEHTLMGRTGEIQIKKFPGSTSRVEFWVRDANKNINRKISHMLDKTDARKNYSLEKIIDIMAKETTFNKPALLSSIGKEIQNLTLPNYDGKTYGMICIATLESNDGYGFNVYQIYVVPGKNGAREYWLSDERPFYGYENENLQTFFNGDK